MKIVPLAEVKAKFSAYVKESAAGPVIVTRNGKPVAVLLGVEDEAELERLVLGYTPRFQALIAAAREQVEVGKGIGHEEIWAGLDEA
jgi:prevent-host-death family protein